MALEYDDVISALADPRFYPEYEGRTGSPGQWPLEHLQTTISHIFVTESGSVSAAWSWS